MDSQKRRRIDDEHKARLFSKGLQMKHVKPHEIFKEPGDIFIHKHPNNVQITNNKATANKIYTCPRRVLIYYNDDAEIMCDENEFRRIYYNPTAVCFSESHGFCEEIYLKVKEVIVNQTDLLKIEKLVIGNDKLL